jgi:hypothetical protein
MAIRHAFAPIGHHSMSLRHRQMTILSGAIARS